MIEVGNIQAGLIGIILLWSALLKLASPESRKTVRESAISALILQPTMAYVAYKLIGIIEFTVGLLFIIPPTVWWKNILATCLSVGFIAYLWLAKKSAPDRACGCMGRRGKAISWRTILRAFYFLSLSIIAWIFEGANWVQALMSNPYLIGVVLFETGIFIALSSEFDWIWPKLSLGKNWYQNLRSGLACAVTKITYQEIVERLHQSMVYQAYHQLLTTGKPMDSWRGGCWFFISYDAKYFERDVSIVFGIPIVGSNNFIRAAIVGREHKSVFLRYDPMDLETLKIVVNT